MAAPIQPGPTFAAGNPQQVVEAVYPARSNSRTYDVSADGHRFLMIQSSATADVPSLVVVEHWLEELKARVPTHQHFRCLCRPNSGFVRSPNLMLS